MKKFTLLFAMLIGMISSAWAQVDVAIDRTGWSVTAFAGTTDTSAEGPVQNMLDGSVSTFFHSDWQDKVSNQNGNNGLQAFMIEMAQTETFNKITFQTRANGSGIPTSYRIYVGDEPFVDFSTMTNDNHNDLLSEETLGTATKKGTFTTGKGQKTATFDTPATGKYILFVSDVSGSYLMCSEFNVYKSVSSLDPTFASNDVIVAGSKAKTITVTTSAEDNSHWYLFTQTRNGESMMYDNGEGNKLKRAASGVLPSSLTGKAVSENTKYLVRFFGTPSSCVMQFANGRFITSDLNSGSTPGNYSLYNINGTDEHFGWNRSDDFKIVDNNGAGNPLSFWDDGAVTTTGGNNDWTVYEVEITDPTIAARVVLQNTIDDANAQAGTDPGWKDATSVNELTTAAQAVHDDSNKNLEEINTATSTLSEAMAALPTIMPENGKIYQLVSANPKFEATQGHKKAMYDNGTQLRWGQLNSSSAAFYWTLTPGDAVYTLQNVGTGRYPAAQTASNTAIPSQEETNTVTLSALGYGQFNITSTGSGAAMHTLGHNAGAGVDDAICIYNAGLGTSSAWYIVEANVVPVTVNLTDQAGNTLSATIMGEVGVTPTFVGAEGYTLSNEAWDGTTFTANVFFPLPTSSETVKNPTTIQSALGESKWCVNSDRQLKTTNASNTNPGYSNQNNWNWYIYPSLDNEGVFTFQMYNVGAGKYIPTITAANQNTATELSDEAGSYQFKKVRDGEAGFYQEATRKFLTINSSGNNQNVWLWTAGGAHMGSTMSFPEAVNITLEDLQAQLAPLASTEKFVLIEGATVISPSEYAAPSEINAAIDAANAVDNNDPVAIETFLSSDDANKIKQFNNASTSHGAPLTTNYVANAGYNTIILPVNWTIPTNWKVYSCSETSGNALTLVEQSTATKNRPYIIKTENDETFQFIGYSNGADTENVKTAGILAGANFATTAPAGSYILTNGSDRFEKVYEDTEVAANQCWITLDSKAAYLLFEAQPTPAKATANMRITDAGWGTFYATFAVAIPEGVKAYTGTLITESETPWIRMDELTEGVIPANTGVVVAKKVEGEAYSEDLEEIETAVATASTCYTGNAYNYNVVVEEGAYLLQKNYVAEKQENVVGWYKVQGKGFTLAPNRCYLAKNTVPEASQARSFIGFEPVDDATGINSIATEAKTKADGKYMVNGQIVVVKAGKAYNMSGAEIK